MCNHPSAEETSLRGNEMISAKSDEFVRAGLSLLSGFYFTNCLRNLCLSKRPTIHYKLRQIRPLPNAKPPRECGNPISRIPGELAGHPKAVRTDDANDCEICFRTFDDMRAKSQCQ